MCLNTYFPSLYSLEKENEACLGTSACGYKSMNKKEFTRSDSLL